MSKGKSGKPKQTKNQKSASTSKKASRPLAKIPGVHPGKKHDQSFHFPGLNQKQASFVRHYLTNGFNASRAYIDAGYAAKNGNVAGASAAKLLKNPKVEAIIREQQRQKETVEHDRFTVTKEQIDRELVKLAFSNPKNLATWDGKSFKLKPSDQVDDDDAVAIASIRVTETHTQFGGSTSVQLRAHDKIRALDILTKIRGMQDAGANDSDESGLDEALAQLDKEEGVNQ